MTGSELPHNFYKLRNAYDTDLTVIPDIVDSALGHFLMKPSWEATSLEIRIVPKFRNRRKATFIMGKAEAIHIEENKYSHPCVCKRQFEEDVQKYRLHMAFNEIRRLWQKIYGGNLNFTSASLWGNDYDSYMPNFENSTSTAKPICADSRGGSASFGHQSIENHVKALQSTHPSSSSSS
ncbi:unnamed protein product [Thelazia callipaeda]|uniref:N-acetyltransferase domain-containing protein n=1 Tax=Thelazia callipaeda TaxID=103827 RepID=A0A0N5CYW9_THECL|nr:unnamed protein product [Thelazia callipaeda]